MEDDFKKSIFYRSLVTSVFVGIFATLATMFYDLVFVEIFGFPLSAIINVASLIFFVNLLFLVIGFIYYGFITLFRKGDLLFILTCILVTVFFAWKAERTHRTDDLAVNTQFHHLLSGITIILGVSAGLAIPFLFHNKRFEKHVL